MLMSDKKIIITGASQGLGACLAYKLAQMGARVILVSRTKELLQKVMAKINKEGGAAEIYECDIRINNDVDKTVAKILESHDKIDVLVNNAGIWTDDDLEKKDPRRRLIALETNVLGHIQFTEAMLQTFVSQGYGTIFNVISSSGVADIPSGNNQSWKTYGASKWAMVGYTNALRESLRESKVKVMQFFPGGFESNLYENANRENPHNQPWMMKTEDVADIIAFSLTRPDDVYMEKIVVSKQM